MNHRQKNKPVVSGHGKEMAKDREGTKKTRPDTWLPVADGLAGADMRVFPLFNSITSTDRSTDQPTNQPTDQPTD